MAKKVYAVVYNDPAVFDEWFESLNSAIIASSYSGGTIYIALIPNASWNFFDIGEKLKKVAEVQPPRKWRIKNA